MKIKPKGRKIYRRKDKIAYHKKIRHDTGSAVVTVLIAGVLVFLGYSAGKPVLNFLQETNFLAPPSYYAEKAEAHETYQSVSESSVANENNAELPLEEVSEVPADSEPEQNEIGFVQKAPSIQGYMLDISALMTESALQSALETIPEGITHLIIPLKVKGGNIYYATSVRDAVRCNAVQAVIPLPTIFQDVSAKGFEPIALINTLEDSVFPKNNPDASYLYPATGEFWTDKSTVPETLWLSPFSVLTKDYLSAIAEEIETAGFRIIICEGLEFPNFPRTELDLLDPKCSESERFQYLTELLTEMRSKAPETAFFVRLATDDIEALSAAEAFPADCLLVPVDEQNVNSYSEISNAVPVLPEWQDDAIPKKSKLKNYVLHPQN